jgi:hypothetical protein
MLRISGELLESWLKSDKNSNNIYIREELYPKRFTKQITESLFILVIMTKTNPYIDIVDYSIFVGFLHITFKLKVNDSNYP